MTIREKMETKLRAALDPIHVAVVNESHLHAVPKGSTTHFKVDVVSARFEGMLLLKCHRMVQDILAEEIASIKALSLHTFTPSEWQTRASEETRSPTCAGANKSSEKEV